MVRGLDDGRWSAIGAGGRDIHRHAHAADALPAHTGAWEIAAIPERVRTLFSKRDGQVKALLAKLGTGYGEASRETNKVAAAESRQRQADREQVDLRADWQRPCQAADLDPAQLVDACRHGRAVLPARPSADVLAAVIDALPRRLGEIPDLPLPSEHEPPAVQRCARPWALPRAAGPGPTPLPRPGLAVVLPVCLPG